MYILLRPCSDTVLRTWKILNKCEGTGPQGSALSNATYQLQMPPGGDEPGLVWLVRMEGDELGSHEARVGLSRRAGLGQRRTEGKYYRRGKKVNEWEIEPYSGGDGPACEEG